MRKGEAVMQHAGLDLIGDPTQRELMIELADASLKKHGNFGVYGDLSLGLRGILAENRVEIADLGPRLNVSIAPLSGVGHDFQFQIDKESLRISGLVVGDVISPPVSPEVNDE